MRKCLHNIRTISKVKGMNIIMIKAGIMGVSGYMGGEVLKILLEHPEVKIEWVTSRQQKKIDSFHRNMYGVDVNVITPENITDCDVVFMALPSCNAMKIAGDFAKKGIKVIDLGADFRINDRNIWERLYGSEHSDWELAKEAVYGIPELHRKEIQSARVVANPGCFSSAAILGLAPLIKNKIIEADKIVVDGLSGTVGAGTDLDIALHHPEITNNILPYNVVDHRHTYEIEQELGDLTDENVSVHFTTSYVPISRGILDICHGFTIDKVSRNEIMELYKDFYKEEYFVKVFDSDVRENKSWNYYQYPWVSTTSGTNYCYIGLDYDEKRKRVVVFSVLDSIGKGGAHVAVQNMNLLFGFEENLGLKRLGSHPY